MPYQKAFSDFNNIGYVGGNFNIWRCPSNEFQIYLAKEQLGDACNSYQPNSWDMTTRQYLGARDIEIRNPSDLLALIEGPYYRTEASKDPIALPTTAASYPHNNGMNILFADGHTDYQKYPLRGRGTYKGGNACYANSYTNGKRWFKN
jgi:prepilin-type processing-associated H-X9-DG protein